MRESGKVRALFVHDHRFVSNGSDVFSPGQFNDRVFARYLASVSELNVVARVRRDSADGCSRISCQRVNFYLLPVGSIGISLTLDAWRSVGRVFKALRASDIGILRLPSFLGVVLGLWMAARGAPYVVELVAHPRDAIRASRRGGRAGPAIAWLMMIMTRAVMSRALGVIYVTRHTLQREFPFHGITAAISNVDLETCVGGGRRTCMTGRRYRIGLIGSFSNPYKGLDTAIRVLRILRDRQHDVELRILGSGDHGPYIDLATSLGVADFVFFDGILQTGEGVFGWLDRLDLYMQPSRTEGLPRALIEAMSRGLPCVGSRAGGIPELLEARWAVAADDCGGFADQLSALLSDPELRAATGTRNAREAAGYSRTELSRRRADFFASVLSALTRHP